VFYRIRLATKGSESGIGLPHSKTLARRVMFDSFREVLECGSPMPLWRLSLSVPPFPGIMLLDSRVWILLTLVATSIVEF
jgi:hypothetical protein